MEISKLNFTKEKRNWNVDAKKEIIIRQIKITSIK
jgi:hypothetical protein